jgi:hypothetical protein
MTDGYRAARLDAADQTNVFTGGSLYARRPNVKFSFQEITVLSAPDLSITQDVNNVRLTWSAVSGASRYLILASTNSETGFVQIANVAGLEFVEEASNHIYYYKVIATTDISAR